MMNKFFVISVLLFSVFSIKAQSKFPSQEYNLPVISKFSFIDDARLYEWKNEGLSTFKKSKIQYRNTLDKALIDSVYNIASKAIHDICGEYPLEREYKLFCVNTGFCFSN